MAWSASDNATWVTSISPSSGAAGSTTITVCYQENTATTSRQATISVTGAGASGQATLDQQGVTPSITITPPTANVSSSPGCFDFTVSSNIAWTASGNATWVTSISPSSGAAGSTTITVCFQENTATISRQADISVAGSGASDQATLIQQGGSTANITITPPVATVSNAQSCFDFTVTSNVAWSASADSTWVFAVLPGVGGPGVDTLTVCYIANTQPSSRSANIIVSGNGASAQATLTQSGSGVTPSGPGWQVTQTGENHTIIIVDTLTSEVNGQPLEAGDLIGFFYEHNGERFCAGFDTIQSGFIGFPVYGNDAAAPDKNGFDDGEPFTVLVWDVSEQEEVDITANYLPEGTQIGPVTIISTDTFEVDGISAVSELSGSTRLLIPLEEGWNLISSYVIPRDSNMLAVFDAIQSEIALVKDDLGVPAIPALGINQIGDWSIQEGYKVRANSDIDLVVEGRKVKPENTPIPIQTGWQFIAYLPDTPRDAVEALQSITPVIELVKDVDGEVYIPGFFNGIGELKPTQGYQLRATGPGSLLYAANGMRPGSGAPGHLLPGMRTSPAEPVHFTSPLPKTGSNATLVLPGSLLSEILEPGDELGVFTAGGQLAGAAVYKGDNLAFPVFGQDEPSSTAGGLLESAPFQVRAWSHAGGREFVLRPSWNQPALYATDNIYYLQSWESLSASGTPAEKVLECRILPNPANESVRLFISNKASAQGLEIYLISARGEALKRKHLDGGEQELSVEWNTRELPAGLYQVVLRSENGQMDTRRLMIIH